jgi:hypothetical protein
MTAERPKDVRDWAERVAAYPRRSPIERALVDHSILDELEKDAARIAELEAENARLRGELADVCALATALLPSPSDAISFEEVMADLGLTDTDLAHKLKSEGD